MSENKENIDKFMERINNLLKKPENNDDEYLKSLIAMVKPLEKLNTELSPPRYVPRYEGASNAEVMDAIEDAMKDEDERPPTVFNVSPKKMNTSDNYDMVEDEDVSPEGKKLEEGFCFLNKGASNAEIMDAMKDEDELPRLGENTQKKKKSDSNVKESHEVSSEDSDMVQQGSRR